MMQLGMEVRLGTGHTVLDGDAAPTRKGAQQPPPTVAIYGRTPNLRPYKPRPTSLVINSWMNQDATWYGGRPWLRQYCVR